MTCSKTTKNGAGTLSNSSKNYDGFLDRSLLMVVFALIGLGLVFVYSSSFIFAQEKYNDALFFLKRQASFAGLGLCVLLLTSCFTPRLLKVMAVLLPIFSLALMCALFVPGLGHRAGGALRWISLPGGLHLEPGEFVKLAAPFVALRLGLSWQAWRQSKLALWRVGLEFLCFVVLPLLLLLKEPDFGSTLIVAMVLLSVFFVEGLPWSGLVTGLLVSLPVGYWLVMSQPYRRARVLAFLHPWSNASGSGFQLVQSLLGIRAGGLTGTGLGRGQAKLFFLPEAHTDFILAVIAEETGFIGLTLVLMLFAWLVFRSFQIAVRCKNPEWRAVGGGLATLLGLEILINSGVVFGLLPAKGLTLPFLSYGGSSLIASCLACGLLLALGRVGA